MQKSAFEKILQEQLQSINTEGDRIARITQIRAQITQLEEQIAELKQQLLHESEALTGDLAIAIRKALPGLSVALNGGRCSVSHLSNNLVFNPNFSSGVWEVEPNNSGRRFVRHHGHALRLHHDVNDLASNIINFFRKRYKRLNNEGMAVRPIGDKAGHVIGYK